MNKQEFATFAAAMKTYYPKEGLLPNGQAMELWFRQLQDIPYIVAEAALQKWVATQKWSPSIAEIREMAMTVTAGDKPLWSDGWEQVQTAIRKYGMYNIGAAMESFDDVTRQTVKRLGFRELCLSENPMQDRANFRMIFEQIAEREQQQKQLPVSLQNLIETMKGEAYEGKRLSAADKKIGQIDKQ